MVLLETMAGVKFQPVHYKGAAPAMNDILAGHIQMGFVSAGSAVPQWKGGKLKLIDLGLARSRRAHIPFRPPLGRAA